MLSNDFKRKSPLDYIYMLFYFSSSFNTYS